LRGDLQLVMLASKFASGVFDGCHGRLIVRLR
jgi:hypothetical protein